MIVGSAFGFIEGYLIFSGDFLLFESPVLAFLQMLMRLSLAIAAVVLGLFVVLKKEKSFVFHSTLVLVCTAISAPFLTNNFGIYFLILAAVFAVTNLLYARVMRPERADSGEEKSREKTD
jgi:hypothetical protein